MQDLYNFQEQLSIGQSWEIKVLSGLWIKREVIAARKATMREQTIGIDLWVEMANHKRLTPLECKKDLKAGTTGNLYYELTTGTKQGCCLTTQSELMLWELGEGQDYMVCTPGKLKQIYERGKYRIRQCRNANGYTSSGALIPLEHLPTVKDFEELINLTLSYATRLQLQRT